MKPLPQRITISLIGTNPDGNRSLMKWEKIPTQTTIPATYMSFIHQLQRDPAHEGWSFRPQNPSVARQLNKNIPITELEGLAPKPSLTKPYHGNVYHIRLKGQDPQGNFHMVEFLEWEAPSLVGGYRRIIDSLHNDQEYGSWSFSPVPRMIQRILAEHGPTHQPSFIPNLRPDNIVPWNAIHDDDDKPDLRNGLNKTLARTVSSPSQPQHLEGNPSP